MQSFAGPARHQRRDRASLSRSRAQVAALAVASALPFVAMTIATLDSVALYLAGKLLTGLGAR